ERSLERSLEQIVMANPNPENLNVPNEGVPEEDPHHLLDYDEEEDPEMEIKEEEPEEEPIEEPKPLPGYGDQFDAHPNPQLGNMNDELEVEEVGVEPGAEGADVELEAEEPDGVPEAAIGAGSQRPFAMRNFPMGVYEIGQPSTARDPQFVGGLAPWALRRDLEALRRHERIREAEAETSRTEVALLGSEAKIGKMEREILHHDLSSVEETLGKVVKRLKALENEENATLRKKLAEKEVLLDLTRMERDRAEKRIMPPKHMSEARMREIIRDQFATSMNEFMANMNSTVGLCQWFERLESVFQISECKEKDRVKFAMATLRGQALTWWNGRTKAMGIEAANSTPWSKMKKLMTEEFCPRSVIQRMEQELYNLRMKGMDIDGYTNRFHELALLCPRMVEPEAVKVEQYIRGLAKSIHGDVTSSQHATINDAVRLAYQLAGQLIQDKVDEATEGKKRKGESDRGGRGDNRREHNRRQNKRRCNAGAMTNAAPNNNETFQKCKNKRHAGDCWKVLLPNTLSLPNPSLVSELV
nr:hypothetical protein [Tanacetum cinerariifolium]